jgi:Skp family chaperone for outer membrane proteins
MRAALAAVLIGGAALAAAPAGAETAAPPALPPTPVLPQTPVLTLDQERLFAGSAFGRRVLGEIAAAEAALAAENRALEEALVAEERALTERRAETEPEAFRALADDFDARVQAIRRAQEAKARSLVLRLEAERQRFFEAAVPVLGQIAREAGAVAILSEQAIVLAFDRIDATDAAIARLDATLGAGAPPAAGD